MTDTFSEPRAPRWTTRMALVVMVLSLAACSTTNPRDPLEPMNRKIFGFNEAVDQILIKPVATGYAAVVPSFVMVVLIATRSERAASVYRVSIRTCPQSRTTRMRTCAGRSTSS